MNYREFLLAAVLRRLAFASTDTLREIDALLDGGHAPRALIGAKLATAERIVTRALPSIRAARSKGNRPADRKLARERLEALLARLANLDPNVADLRPTTADLDGAMRCRTPRTLLAYLRLRTGAFGCPRKRAAPTPSEIESDASLIAKNIEAAKRRD